jgi:hypothetical protein
MMSLENLPWSSEDVPEQVDAPLICSPQSIDNTQSPTRSRPDDSTSLESIRSYAQPVQWGSVTIEHTHEELETFSDIPIALEALMEMLQQLLKANQFRWFHPSDVRIVARSPFTETIVRFEVKWLGAEFLALAIVYRAGPASDEVKTLIAQIAERMGI